MLILQAKRGETIIIQGSDGKELGRIDLALKSEDYNVKLAFDFNADIIIYRVKHGES